MSYEKGPSLRSLIFRLMLSFGLALAGLMGLLLTRLKHPLVLELLRPWRAPDHPSALAEGIFSAGPLMKNQFAIDFLSAAMAGLGLFLVIYYRRRLSPLLNKLEEMSLDRW